MAREWEGVGGRSAVPRWLQTRQTYNTASSSPLSSFPYHFCVASHSLFPLIPMFNFAPLFNFVPFFYFDSFSSFLSLFAPSSPLRHDLYPYHSFYYENLWSLYFHFTRRHLNFSFFIFGRPWPLPMSPSYKSYKSTPYNQNWCHWWCKFSLFSSLVKC